jgi:hypothetical protein
VAKLTIALCIVLLWTGATIAQPSSLDDVYTTRAVVTGTDERNRPLGFNNAAIDGREVPLWVLVVQKRFAKELTARDVGEVGASSHFS